LISPAILSLSHGEANLCPTLRIDQQSLCVRLPLTQTFALGSLAEEKSENIVRKHLILPGVR
jgi:hypothetical protein